MATRHIAPKFVDDTMNERIESVDDFIEFMVTLVLHKIKYSACEWNKDSTEVNVGLELDCPMTLIDINDSSTTIKSDCRKILKYQFEREGFSVIDPISFDGRILIGLSLRIID